MRALREIIPYLALNNYILDAYVFNSFSFLFKKEGQWAKYNFGSFVFLKVYPREDPKVKKQGSIIFSMCSKATTVGTKRLISVLFTGSDHQKKFEL